MKSHQSKVQRDRMSGGPVFRLRDEVWTLQLGTLLQAAVSSALGIILGTGLLMRQGVMSGRQCGDLSFIIPGSRGPVGYTLRWAATCL